MSTRVKDNARQSSYRWGGFAFAVALFALLTALALQYLGGYEPCPLCHQQRYIYYAGIPLLFVALILVSADVERIGAVLFFIVAIAFLGNAGLGVYHAGAEWGFWPGPDTCAAVTGGMKPLDLTSGIGASAPAVNCTEPALRVFGLSLAAWNAIASLVIHISSLKAAAYGFNQS